VYFFYKNNWEIDRKIVESRSGMSFKDILAKCIKMLEEMDNKHILDGIGELISSAQKDWAREKLRNQTIFLLKINLDNEK
jgi:hypothetical protein